jgi:hypothetical protein
MVLQRDGSNAIHLSFLWKKMMTEMHYIETQLRTNGGPFEAPQATVDKFVKDRNR